MNSTATELELTRRRAMRGIVKGFVVGTLGLIQKEELRMRKSIVFTIALTTLAFVAGEASATRLTEQQVRNSCAGTKSFAENELALGCEKTCGPGGKNICAYGCTKDKNGKVTNCTGDVIGAGNPGSPTGPARRIGPAQRTQ